MPVLGIVTQSIDGARQASRTLPTFRLRAAEFLRTSGLILAVCLSSLHAGPAESSAARMHAVAKALGIPNAQVIDVASSRLNRGRTIQTVAITSVRREGGHPLGGDVVVLERRGGSLVPAWRQRGLNPWKLVICDVDGDGRREIAVGVWKKSPKDPVMARRTFFYSWNGRRMMPKWLGSKLSRRFDDFTLGDINGDGWDELVALEIVPGGRHRIAAYRWFTFGFEWLGCSGDLPGLTRIGTTEGKVVASFRRGRANVAFSRGKVVLAR